MYSQHDINEGTPTHTFVSEGAGSCQSYVSTNESLDTHLTGAKKQVSSGMFLFLHMLWLRNY